MSKGPARGPIRSGARLRLKPGDKKRLAGRVERQEVVALRRSYRIAIGSLLLSLVVALLSTGTSFVSMRSSERQAKEALASNDRQADEEFRRTNQRVAYAEFQIQMVRADNGVNRFRTAVVAGSGTWSPQQVRNGMQSLIDGMTPMNDKFAVVQMVASANTLQSATDWLSITSNAIWLLSSSLSYGGNSFQVDRAKLTSVDQETKEMARLRAIFLEDARSDVNAYG